MTEEPIRPGRTLRIFVSSTFSDLKAERDALQRYVFPRLRELCPRPNVVALRTRRLATSQL